MPLTCASGASVSISAISAPHPAATTTPVSNRRVVVHGARSAPARASPNTMQRRRERAGERGRRHQRRGAGEHGAQRTDRRPARNAQDVGVGQRIAQQHLHQRAGERQQAADRERRQRAGQAQLAHDRGLGSGRASRRARGGSRRCRRRRCRRTGPGPARPAPPRQARRGWRAFGRGSRDPEWGGAGMVDGRRRATIGRSRASADYRGGCPRHGRDAGASGRRSPRRL